jgi:hypothetical protein
MVFTSDKDKDSRRTESHELREQHGGKERPDPVRLGGESHKQNHLSRMRAGSRKMKFVLLLTRRRTSVRNQVYAPSLGRRKETAAPEEIKKKRIRTGDMKSCPARFVRRTKTASTREEQTSKQSRLSANETALGSGVFQRTTKAGTRAE